MSHKVKNNKPQSEKHLIFVKNTYYPFGFVIYNYDRIYTKSAT